MTHPATAGFKAFAGIIGCKPGYVTELRKGGRLVLTDDGRAVRVAESIARIEATRDPAMQVVAERHATDRGEHLASAPAPNGNVEKVEQGQINAEVFDGADTADGAEGTAGYQEWRARRERAAALRDELRLGEEAGQLIRREDAVAVVSNAFVTLRTDLEALPDSIASVLAAETDVGRVRTLLGEEISHALGNLSTHIITLGHKG